MTDFKDKVVLITGGSRGIGKELVYTLAKTGAQVVACARNLDKLIEICNDLTGQGFKAYPIKLDLESEESIKGAVAKTVSMFGTVDILINNAGVQELCPVVDMSTESFDKVMNVNIRGVFIMTREVLPYMKAKKWGKIVSIGSLSGRRGYPEQAAYCASKHALVGFTKCLAYEVQKDNIGVCVVAPGGVLTDMSKDLRISRGDTNEAAWLTPAQIVEGVMFVLNQEGACFTDELVLRRFASEPWR